MNLYDIIIDKSPAQKKMRVDVLRAELKTLGYSVVEDRYFAGLLVQARRRPALEAAE